MSQPTYRKGDTRKINALTDAGLFASIDDQSVVGRIHCFGITKGNAELLRDRVLLALNLHDELVEALRAASSECCQYDRLNPCWNNRPTDVAGKHWGGGKACPVCYAHAVLAKIDVAQGGAAA